jgi:undecaprenyl diphosphate synthase
MPRHSTHSFAELTEDDLFSQLDQDALPRHVAVIMDGNGRWASHRGLPRIAGHREGLIAVREMLNTCYRLGIPIVTVYAFSQENWNRPQVEIDLLMTLLEEFLLQERQTFQEQKIRFFSIGLLHELPVSTQDLVQAVTRETEHFTDRTVVVALSYGGRSEIIDATNRLIDDIQCGKTSGPVHEAQFEQYLSTSGLPDPDLLIRTSGEARISNFLLWQIAYTELYFTNTLWPDFRRREVLLALLDYQKRDRRFGRLPHAASPQNRL